MLQLKCFVSPTITQYPWDTLNIFFWGVYGQAGWSTALFQLFKRRKWRNWGWSWNCTGHSVKKENAGVESPQTGLSWVSRVRLYTHSFEKKKFLEKIPKKVGGGRNADGGAGGAGMKPWYYCHPPGSEWDGHIPAGIFSLDLCNATSQLLQYSRAGLIFRPCPRSALKRTLGGSHIYILGPSFHPVAHSKQETCQAVCSSLLAYFSLV